MTRVPCILGLRFQRDYKWLHCTQLSGYPLCEGLMHCLQLYPVEAVTLASYTNFMEVDPRVEPTSQYLT